MKISSRFLKNEELTLPLHGEGYRSEERARAALQRLKKENIISDFLKANVKDDMAGIDFWVITPGDQKYIEIPLQVKSSTRFQKEHIVDHPKIPSIVVGHIHFQKVIKKTKKIISKYKEEKVLHI